MTHPNIILLVLDAVRANCISAYHDTAHSTPQIDAFAAENLLFKRAFAPATWTIPTHASLLSGLYLSQHRLESVKADRMFSEDIVTLPEALQANGYHTAAFSQNILFSNKHHLTESFDEFFPLWNGQHRKTRHFQPSNNRLTRYWQTTERYWEKMTGLRRAFDFLYKWLIVRNDEAPIFTVANITSAHYPWAPSPGIMWQRLGWDIRYLKEKEFATPNPFRFNSERQTVSDRHRRIWHALYEAAILHLDQEIGRFLSLLRRWPGWSNTVLIITADHGELLGEYRDIVGHTLCLHDHLLHVPLIIRHPDHSTGAMIEGVVQSLDLYSSILEWSNIPDGEIPNAQRQRAPLSAAIATPSDCSGLAFAEEDYTDSYNPIQGLLKVNPEMSPRKYPHRQIAVRSATHKYIWFDDRPAEFYDLVADPAEANNLINTDTAEERNHLAMLQHSLTTWRANLELFPPRAVNEMEQLEPEMVERLRVLGYVV